MSSLLAVDYSSGAHKSVDKGPFLIDPVSSLLIWPPSLCIQYRESGISSYRLLFFNALFNWAHKDEAIICDLIG